MMDRFLVFNNLMGKITTLNLDQQPVCLECSVLDIEYNTHIQWLKFHSSFLSTYGSSVNQWNDVGLAQFVRF